MTKRLIATFGGIATVAVLLVGHEMSAGAAVASISGHANPTPKPGPKPPNTEVKQTREGVQVHVEDRMTRSRKTQTKKESAGHKPVKVDGRHPRQVRDSPPGSSLDELKLNIGICGRRGADGTFPGPTRCQPFVPDAPDPAGQTLPPVVVQAPRPSDVTWEQILAESKDVLFPQLHVKVQPAGRTLVNLDTIVYTDESKVSTNTVTLLGFPVVVEATPMSYSWNFGDGSPALTTTSPGKPHPSKEITHKYMKRGSTKVTLTTNYAARFNVAGTGWQYVDGIVPITGPATALLIREAVPVLVDPPR